MMFGVKGGPRKKVFSGRLGEGGCYDHFYSIV